MSMNVLLQWQARLQMTSCYVNKALAFHTASLSSTRVLTQQVTTSSHIWLPIRTFIISSNEIHAQVTQTINEAPSYAALHHGNWHNVHEPIAQDLTSKKRISGCWNMLTAQMGKQHIAEQKGTLDLVVRL